MDNGIFEFQIEITDEMLDAESLFYEIALDLDQNGLSEDDFFPDRFELNAVPYAARARSAKFFSTLGGRTAGANVIHFGFTGKMVVCPFLAPAGGVRFSRMLVLANSTSYADPQKFSFGIYDRHKKLVYYSGLQDPTGLVSVNVSGRLRPSELYDTAWAYCGESSPEVATCRGVPDHEELGEVDIGNKNAQLPTSFAAMPIVQVYQTAPMNITLFE